MNAADYIQHFIAHAEYDPSARRERYLRERELKGRMKGVGVKKVGGRPAANESPPKGGGGPKNVAPPSNLVEVAKVRQAALQVRLERLQTALQKLVAEAASDSKSSSSDTSSNETSEKGAPKEKASAKEKREARARYEKNKDPKSTSSEPTESEKAAARQEKIQEIREKIQEIRAKLKEAAAKAAATRDTKSDTAPEGR